MLKALRSLAASGLLLACQPYNATTPQFKSNRSPQADEKPADSTESKAGEKTNQSQNSNSSETSKRAGPGEEGSKKPNSSSPAAFLVALPKVAVTNASGAKPLKGDSVLIKLTLKNGGTVGGSVKVTPILSSKRFTDYENVRLPSQDVKLEGEEAKEASFTLEPFFRNEANKKEYALNRGGYKLSFEIEGNGIEKKVIDNVAGKDFDVQKSNVVLTAVFWSRSYFDKVKYTGGVMKWMQETFTRKAEIMTPTTPGGTTGSFQTFNKGFDEMMGVRTKFKAFEGFALDRNLDFSGSGILHQVEAYGKKALGLQKDFQGRACDAMTHVDNHGYDMAIGLDKDGFGGIAWRCGNVSANGVFDGDPTVGRTQMVLIHEVSHNYGAPHCDPIQGFLMCSGEKHERYKNGGSFVWHKDSINAMKKKEEENITNRFALFEKAGELDLTVCPD